MKFLKRWFALRSEVDAAQEQIEALRVELINASSGPSFGMVSTEITGTLLDNLPDMVEERVVEEFSSVLKEHILHTILQNKWPSDQRGPKSFKAYAAMERMSREVHIEFVVPEHHIMVRVYQGGF